MALYRALYRKYRPADFSDVYGQPHIVHTLKNQIEEGKLSHAYLFTGSRGTGKTTCAKILAKAVNCLHPQNGNPCNQCEICRAAADDTLVDITEIDAASNNGVDDIRELRDNTAYTPVAAKYRVFIIDEVHMLSTAAFNALLKTLEEPPEHVLFILATTEVHKLPATILSRCQRFDFRRIQPDDISKRLKQVAQAEKIALTDDGAYAIAKLADGAMRDALSMLDVCAADKETVDEKKVLEVAGLSGREYLHDIAAAVADKNTRSALELIDQLYKRAKDLSRLCTELIAYCRDMMMIKAVEHAEQYVFASSDELRSLKELAEKMPMEKIIHAIDVWEDTLVRIGKGADRRTAVERAVIMLCEPQLDTTYTALLSRISALENKPAAANPAVVPAPVERAEKAPAATDEKTQTAAAEDIAQAPAQPQVDAERQNAVTDGEFEQWSEVLAQLSHTDIMLKAALKGSKAYIQGDLMLIDIVNDSFRDMINGESRHRTSLKQAILTVTGKQFRIGPYTGKSTPVKTETDPLDSLIKNARDNGLI